MRGGRGATLAALAALSVIAASSPARAADPTPSLAIEPAPAGDPGAVVERAAVRGHLLVSGRLFADYARMPLAILSARSEEDPVVSDQVYLHALVTLALWHRIAVHVDVPFAPLQAGSQTPADGVGARARLVSTDADAKVHASLGVAAWLWAPTATDGYTGDGSARGAVHLVAEGDTPRFYWAASAGARVRPLTILDGVLPYRTGSGLSVGLAAGFFADAKREIRLGVEGAAELTLDGANLFDPRASVAHLLASAHYHIAGGPFEVGAAFGPGVGQGAGAADYRLMGFFGVAPTTPPPPPDEDADGIPDKLDACPDIDGVASGDPLLNGCPEPPRDRDGDAIPDQYDACPRVPGEATAERKTHGCPRVRDIDSDGVPDDEDDCPREAGPKPPEGSGCPAPKAPSAAELVADVIVLSQMVQFETGTATLRPESDSILGEVARILREHPELEQVEVQGHTDERGSPDLNRTLGKERAQSVVAWLTGRGIAADRLVAKGYGSDAPIADNSTEEGRAKNRRVELRVIRAREAPKSDAPKSDAPKNAPPQGGEP